MGWGIVGSLGAGESWLSLQVPLWSWMGFEVAWRWGSSRMEDAHMRYSRGMAKCMDKEDSLNPHAITSQL